MLQAITYTNGSDVIAAAKAVRNRLWKPAKINIAPARPSPKVHVEFVERKEQQPNYGGYTASFFNSSVAKTKRAMREAERRESLAAEIAKRQKLKQEHLDRIEALKRETLAERAAAYKAAIEIPEERAKLSLTNQIKNLCGLYGYDYKIIIGTDRMNDVVKARHMLIGIIAGDNPLKTAAQIGDAFGGRDPATIRNALAKIGMSKIQKVPYGAKKTTQKTGTPGVILTASGRFRARVYHEQDCIECGLYGSFDEAVEAQNIQKAAILDGGKLSTLKIRAMIQGDMFESPRGAA